MLTTSVKKLLFGAIASITLLVGPLAWASGVPTISVQPTSQLVFGGLVTNYNTYYKSFGTSGGGYTNLVATNALAQFSVTASGATGYRWYQNGNLLVGQTASTLVVAAAATNSGATFQVVCTNTTGSVTSSVATLTVDLPTATFAFGFDAAARGYGGTEWTLTSATVGDAFWDNDAPNYPAMPDRLMLAHSDPSHNGNAWFNPATINAGTNWNFAWTMQMAYGPSLGQGGEGMGLVLQADGTADVVSGDATTNGISGITGAYVSIFFDTRNNDSSDLSVSTLKVKWGGRGSSQTNSAKFDLTAATAYNGTVNCPGGSTAVTASAGVPFNATASYVAASKLLVITVGNTALASGAQGSTNNPVVLTVTNVNLAQTFGSQPAYAGYIAQTIDSKNQGHSLLNASAQFHYTSPIITSQPVSVTTNGGANVTFTVAAFSSVSPAYQWQLNGTNILNATNASYTVIAASASVGSYDVIISNGAGSVTSSAAVLAATLPVITTQPVGFAGNPGDYYTLTVGLKSDVPAPTCQWQVFGPNNTPVNIGTNSTSYANYLNGAGQFRVVVSNPAGSVTSSVVNVAIKPYLTMQPVSQIITNASQVYLQSSFNGTAATCQWLKDGVALVGQTNDTLLFAPFKFGNSGIYQVVVTSPYGMVISQPASLSFRGAPLLGWGYDGWSGCLLDGISEQDTPALIDSNVVCATAGGVDGVDSSLYVKNDGTLWGRGFLDSWSTNNLQSVSPLASNVVVVTAGALHALFIKKDGTLWAMGQNDAGQLGNGDKTGINFDSPQCVASNVVAMAAGNFHSLFVKSDGTLWGMGFSAFGQLGSKVNYYYTPVLVATNVMTVAAAGVSSYFIKNDGTLWGMGDNSYGQLGLGNSIQQDTPVCVSSNVISVTAGYSDDWGGTFALYIKNDGTLWGMGYNGIGQLGNGDGNDFGSGANVLFPQQIATNVASVKAGCFYSQFVKSDGTLWGMGGNWTGQLGVGHQTDVNGFYSKNLPVQVAGARIASLGVLSQGAHSLAIGYMLPQLGSLTNLTVVAGQPANFSVPINPGTGDSIYAWFFKGTNYEFYSLTNALSIPAALPDYAGTYSANVISYWSLAGWGDVASSSATLTVTAVAPQITQLTNQSVMLGNAFTFAVAVTNGTAPFSYQWSFNGTNLLNATNSSYSVASAVLANAGSYAVGVTGLGGSASSSASLTVTLPPPPAITAQPAATVVALGGSASLSVTATNNGFGYALTYQWLKDGAILLGQTNSTLTLGNVGVTDAGNYQVVVSSAYGLVISLPAKLVNAGMLSEDALTFTQFYDSFIAPDYTPLDGRNPLVGGAWSDQNQNLFIYNSKLDTSVTAWNTESVNGALAFGPLNNALGVGQTLHLNFATGIPMSGAVFNDKWAGISLFTGGIGGNEQIFIGFPGGVGQWGITGPAVSQSQFFPDLTGASQLVDFYYAYDTGAYTLQIGSESVSGTCQPHLLINTVRIASAAGYWDSNAETTMPGEDIAVSSIGASFTENTNAQVFFQTYDGNPKCMTAWTMLAGSSWQTLPSLGAFFYNGSTNLPINAGIYTVIAPLTNAAFTGSVTNTLVIVKATPVITNWPAVAAVYGQDLTHVTLTGGSASTAGSFALASTNGGTPLNGAKVCVVFNPADTLDYITVSNLVSLKVTIPTPLITTQPMASVVALGDSASLSFSATNNGGGYALVYQWLKDGAILTGQTNTTLTLGNVGITNCGNYQVVVSSPYGMVISLPASVSVPGTTLVGWGFNNQGQLGNGTEANTNLPANLASNVVSVAAGSGHSLYVKNDGTLWAMGANNFGQLGDGNYQSTNLPVAVASNVVAVAAGYAHSLFVKNDGTLWAMGKNSSGQLGDGNYQSTNLPVAVASNVVAVAAGYAHSLFVKNDGTLWAMGANNFGQLGNGSGASTNLPVQVASNVVAVGAGSLFSLYVKNDGTLWAMGANDSGQLGNGDLTGSNVLSAQCVASNVVAVAAGAAHSLLVKNDGTLWAMGANDSGQLGNGSSDNNAHPIPVAVASNVVAVGAGSLFSLYVKNDGTLWAMGANSVGQLGIGNTVNQSLPVQVSGLTVASLGVKGLAYNSFVIGSLAQTTTPVTVSLSNLSQTYDGTGKSVSVSTTPSGISTSLTYNGSANAPTNAGSYTVIATVTDAAYTGSATNTLVISQAAPVITQWPTAAAIILSQDLTRAILTGGNASTVGNFAWATASIVPSLGSTNFSVVFTPADFANYVPVTNSVTVVINPVPNLLLSKADHALTLTWTGKMYLQTAATVNGVYTNVPYATSPFVITNFNESQRFYRIMVP